VYAMRCAAAHHGRVLWVRANAPHPQRTSMLGSDDGDAQDGSARRRMELPKHGVAGALGLARGGVAMAFSVARGVMRAPDQLSKAAGVPDNPVNLTFNGTPCPLCTPSWPHTRQIRSVTTAGLRIKTETLYMCARLDSMRQLSSATVSKG
jgi:hypothetical protein